MAALFFVAVAFWNLVGAGVFGFLINPPIVLYYAQGINTTPIHSHGALFGVYGFLAIALTLFSMRHIVRKEAWSDGLLKGAFWGLNVGLASMMAFSLIPSGFYQFLEAIRHGLWYARSPAVTALEFIQTVTWLRAVPDVFLGGAPLLAFVVRAIVSTSASAAPSRQKSGPPQRPSRPRGLAKGLHAKKTGAARSSAPPPGLSAERWLDILDIGRATT